ncbi:hypothetical protein AMTR_s00111p00030690 [Amborella trichopoda]|uniref:Uncharacterized protein n=1 Tax=Amborella trichopoda TaxID=13333 RepID=W1NWY3_AMBTC|nr:hypothetical protein AMTR_s00111p00030690 [Amborella trichopoda]
MDYLQRLKAAAFFAQSRDSDEVSLNFDELGILGHLKPHQIHGVSWLVRRYVCGVNVILGARTQQFSRYQWLNKMTSNSRKFMNPEVTAWLGLRTPTLRDGSTGSFSFFGLEGRLCTTKACLAPTTTTKAVVNEPLVIRLSLSSQIVMFEFNERRMTTFGKGSLIHSVISCSTLLRVATGNVLLEALENKCKSLHIWKEEFFGQ